MFNACIEPGLQIDSDAFKVKRLGDTDDFQVFEVNVLQRCPVGRVAP